MHSDIIFSNLITSQMMQLKPKKKCNLSTFAESTSGRAEIKTWEIKTSSLRANGFPLHLFICLSIYLFILFFTASGLSCSMQDLLLQQAEATLCCGVWAS